MSTTTTPQEIKKKLRRALGEAKNSIEPVLTSPIKENQKAIEDLGTYFKALNELTLIGLRIKDDLVKSNVDIQKGEDVVVSHLNNLSDLILCRFNDYVFMMQPEEFALTLKEIKPECLEKTFAVLDSETKERVIKVLESKKTS